MHVTDGVSQKERAKFPKTGLSLVKFKLNVLRGLRKKNTHI